MAENEKQKGKEQGLKDFGIISISGAIPPGLAEVREGIGRYRSSVKSPVLFGGS